MIKVYIMFDKFYLIILGLVLFVVIIDDVFVVRIRLNIEILLDKVLRFFSGELE